MHCFALCTNKKIAIYYAQGEPGPPGLNGSPGTNGIDGLPGITGSPVCDLFYNILEWFSTC